MFSSHDDRIVDQQTVTARAPSSSCIQREAEYPERNNVAITAIGSVRPVITVLRQLPRNRNTISNRQQRTFDNRYLDVCLTAPLTKSDVERSSFSSVPAGKSLRMSSSADLQVMPT